MMEDKHQIRKNIFKTCIYKYKSIKKRQMSQEKNQQRIRMGEFIGKQLMNL